MSPLSRKSREEKMDSRGSKITDFAQISSLAEGPWMPSTSLTLLKHLRNKKPNPAKSDALLSTACVMKLAKERLDQIKSQRTCLELPHLTDHLSIEDSKDVELALLLQAASDKVANQEWTQAEKLLNFCNISASKDGNPVQRVVYYFAKALGERIGQESGKLSSGEQERQVTKAMYVRQAEIHLQPDMMECQQEAPTRIATQAASIQAILDVVGSSKRIHLVDFGICNGSHWILLMQNLAVRTECPVEILKITAVGTSKEMLEVTGNQLSSFAKGLNLPFSFLTVLSELKDLNEGLFDLDPSENEILAVYSDNRLSTLLSSPHGFESILGCIRNLNPCIMVVREMEASVNSNDFQERFDEALPLFSAMFDTLDGSMEHRIAFRTHTEEIIFQEMIQNIVAMEGSGRVIRFERISFWKELFAKFGMVEMGFGSSSMSQVTMSLGLSDRFSSSTLKMDGKSLIFGWNETSILSLSAWKFQQILV